MARNKPTVRLPISDCRHIGGGRYNSEDADKIVNLANLHLRSYLRLAMLPLHDLRYRMAAVEVKGLAEKNAQKRGTTKLKPMERRFQWSR